MKRKLLTTLAILLIVSLVLVPTVGCAADPTKDIKALKEAVAALNTSINDVAGDVGGLQSDIASLRRDVDNIGTTGVPADITNRLSDVEGDVSSIVSQIAGIQDDVAALQGEETNGSSSNGEEEETTTWAVEPWLSWNYQATSGKIGELVVDVPYHGRIEDEDYYSLWVEIVSTYQVDIQLTEIGLSFRPKERVKVSDDTDLYDQGLNLDWDVEVSRTSGDLCRRITASAYVPTNRLVIPAAIDEDGNGTIEAGEVSIVQFQVYFDLFYE